MPFERKLKRQVEKGLSCALEELNCYPTKDN